MCSMLDSMHKTCTSSSKTKCHWGGGHKIPSLTEKLLVKDRKGAIDLLKGVALAGLTHLVDGPKPKHI